MALFVGLKDNLADPRDEKLSFDEIFSKNK